jgi:hypothetical protein
MYQAIPTEDIMISLVRNVQSIQSLPLQTYYDTYKDDGMLVLLPNMDYMNWIEWSNLDTGILLARIQSIDNGKSTVALVGCASSEDHEYGNIYMSKYLMNKIGILNGSTTRIVRIEPYIQEIPKGTYISVKHDTRGIDIFEKLQETIMDWAIIEKDVVISLRFERDDDIPLIVDVTVTDIQPNDVGVIRLGGEIALDIEGPEEPKAEDQESTVPLFSSSPAKLEAKLDTEIPVWRGEAHKIDDTSNTPDTLDERRRRIRESWLKRTMEK